MPIILRVLLTLLGGWFFKLPSHLRALLVIVLIVGFSMAVLAVQHIDLEVGGARFERGSDNLLGLRLGLDLAGGVHLVYQAGSEDVKPTADQMKGLLTNIRRRVDSLGASEPNIQQLGEDRVLIQLPGLEDVDRAKRLIGQTAQLRIVERVCQDAACTQFEDRDTGLSGEDIASANAGQGTVGEPILLFELKRGAARAFAELTTRIFNSNPDSPDQLAYVLDEITLVSATVRSPILAGSGQISGGFTPEEVRDLAIQIESGRLPIPISVLTEKVVDASLGSSSLRDSLIAGIVGLALVLFFMVSYYRGSGIVAALALFIYTTLVLAVFKLMPVTLTLAGVAGFVLSMGMAVDANILIFERMKEELRIGRTLNFALRIGFQRAWSSIRDGNISTLIIAFIIYWFGNQFAASTVTSFAVTLIVGVFLSMFTAIFITRNLLQLLAVTAMRRMPGLFTPEPLPKREEGSPRPRPASEQGA
uniref:Putative export membrane protein n=1 Tax=uncultured marine microorganism HF4000_APKG7H23 TaxID=455551 RepID=B3T9T5_9ZZZZ|nr:putative export membrane protein [uncultured marine microorganism HF4000_APKG7H23]